MIINNPISDFYRILLNSVSNLLNDVVKYDRSISSVDYPITKEFEFVSYINIVGCFTGTLFLFASQKSLNFIFESVYDTNYFTLNNDNLVQDSMDEFLNHIIANSTDAFSKNNTPINIGVPRQQNKEEAQFILTQLESGIILNSSEGKLLLTFVKNK